MLCQPIQWTVGIGVVLLYWIVCHWKSSVGEKFSDWEQKFVLLQCFSTFVRPRPGKFFFFIRLGPGPNKFTHKYLSSFVKFIH